MSNRRDLDGTAMWLMVAFCFTLGLQQIALKLAADDVAPILQIAIRSGIGAVLVWLYMIFKNERIKVSDGNWKPGLLVGSLFAIEYLFLGEALRYTSASHAVVFLYTSPIFAAILLHVVVPSERLTLAQWTGVIIAFSGIGVAFLNPELETTNISLSDRILGDTLALLGGAAWGVTTVLIRTSRLATVSPRETLLYQLICAFIVLLCFAVGSDQFHLIPSQKAIGSILFQSIFVAFFAFLVWFWLIKTYQATMIGILSFMTPIFGVILGVLILGESLHTNFVIGGLMVMLGVLMVTAYKLVRKLRKF